jgi:hypothetical protein
MNTENNELWEICVTYNVQLCVTYNVQLCVTYNLQAVSMDPRLIRQLYDAQQDTTDNIAKYYIRHRECFLGMDKRVNISSIQDMGEK